MLLCPMGSDFLITGEENTQDNLYYIQCDGTECDGTEKVPVMNFLYDS